MKNPSDAAWADPLVREQAHDVMVAVLDLVSMWTSGGVHRRLPGSALDHLEHRLADAWRALTDACGKPKPVRVATPLHGWEDVCDDHGKRVRRLRVTGGWLYQIQIAEPARGRHDPVTPMMWSIPAFVPEGVAVGVDATVVDTGGRQ